jgi:hypothetical protein
MNQKLAQAIEEIAKLRRCEADVVAGLSACPVERLPEAMAAIAAIDFAASASSAAWAGGAGAGYGGEWREGARRAQALAVEALDEILRGGGA